MSDLFDEAFHHAAKTQDEATVLLAEAGLDEPVPRARALGYYMQQPNVWDAGCVGALLVWFVRRHPNDLICSFPTFIAWDDCVPVGLTNELSKVWSAHELEHRLDAIGLRNASAFFAPRDWTAAERLLLTARRRPDGGPSVGLSLGKLRACLAQRGDGSPMEHARAALSYLEALANGEATPHAHERQYARQICAEAALAADEIEVARRYALMLLEEQAPHGLLHHVAHTVLGLIALRRDDVPTALEALANAAATRPDFVSSSYGPRLALAKELLLRGERDAVVEYLRKRLESWDHPDAPIVRWIAALEAGGTPGWDEHHDHI